MDKLEKFKYTYGTIGWKVVLESFIYKYVPSAEQHGLFEIIDQLNDIINDCDKI